MVGLIELNVVDDPFSWRAVSSMLISVPELTQLFVSCGGIGTVWRSGASKQSLFHRNLERAGVGAGWVPLTERGLSRRSRPVCGASIACGTSA